MQRSRIFLQQECTLIRQWRSFRTTQFEGQQELPSEQCSNTKRRPLGGLQTSDQSRTQQRKIRGMKLTQQWMGSFLQIRRLLIIHRTRHRSSPSPLPSILVNFYFYQLALPAIVHLIDWFASMISALFPSSMAIFIFPESSRSSSNLPPREPSFITHVSD